MDFHIAGFTYWDGLDVIGYLNLGTELTLRCEPDNVNDPGAVAIFYDDVKIGYIPRYKNEEISKLLYFGHGDMFETKISMVSLDSHPERQFRVTVRIKDAQ